VLIVILMLADIGSAHARPLGEVADRPAADLAEFADRVADVVEVHGSSGRFKRARR